MTQLKMILSDKTELKLEGFNLPATAVLKTTKSNLSDLLNNLKEENLRNVSIMNNDIVMIEFDFLVIESIQMTFDSENNTIVNIFIYMNGNKKDDVDPRLIMTEETFEYVQAAKILLGEGE